MILETYFLACNPAAYAIAAIVTAIAGSAVTITAQQNQAEAQSDYQTKLGRENNKAAARQAEMARDEQAQAKEAAARDAAAAALASKRAKSSALTAAGESGVSGNSVDALLRDYRAQEGFYKEALIRQNQLTDVGTGQKVDAIMQGATASNLSMNAPIAQPNYLSAALKVGEATFGAMRQYQLDKKEALKKP